MVHEQLGADDVLAAAEAAAPAESVDVVARTLRHRLGASAVSFLFVDILGRRMVRVTEGAMARRGRSAQQIPLAGSDYEQVLRTQRLTRATDGEGRERVLAPVTNRGDTLGVLELTLPHAGPDAMEQIRRTARALAYVIVTNRRFTDLYHWGRRTTPVTLAAEIQHQLLPSPTGCDAPQFSLAAALVPAESVGGDTYDYSLDEDTLHVSVTDAMGHDINAALLATVVVNASRGARRDGCDLAEQALRTHRAMLAHGRGALTTGQLLRVALDGGGALLVNAGHPWPLRLRADAVEEIGLDVNLPFGVPSPVPYRVQEVELRPGDRLVFYTDGMRERRAGRVDLPALVRETAALHPREAVQALTTAVADASGGRLQDDATVLCLDWHGPDDAHPSG
ncbi:PP2C family protein-serine/threonine phosphatase [Streptomyces avicenniae]|uniref:PP2C family protein-serine/threonine phosphatase n=1 Tax=Streptomyces avicenniae TaxID=500153 RepID=UPI00069954F0|nr:PP2C family protein-serine/threonine phosphatase [Streptomyces avicenniae]